MLELNIHFIEKIDKYEKEENFENRDSIRGYNSLL